MLTRQRLSWLLFTLASGAFLAVSCGGDDDTTGGAGGKAGSGGSTATGGSAGSGGTGGSAGNAGKGGSAGKDGGASDAAMRIPCGETSCSPTATNRLCNESQGRCVSCLNDTHCTSMARPKCDVMNGNCRECLTNADCTAPEECIISTSTTGNNTCQPRCNSDADCASMTNNKACNTTTRMCVECLTNAHCVGNTGGAICNTANNQCEACVVNTDCTDPNMPICRTTGTNACVQCASNADCASRPGTPACVTTGATPYTCRQCNAQTPCPAGQVCSMSNCVAAPEPGLPEAGRDGSEGGTEGGADTSTDTTTDTLADSPADVASEGG